MIALKHANLNLETILIGNAKVHALLDLLLMIKFKVYKLVLVNVDKYSETLSILSIIDVMILNLLLVHIA